MSSFICQNEVNMANEPLKVEQPLLESLSEIHKLVYDLYQIFPRHQNYRDGDNIPSHEFWVMENYWLTLGQSKYS